MRWLLDEERSKEMEKWREGAGGLETVGEERLGKEGRRGDVAADERVEWVHRTGKPIRTWWKLLRASCRDARGWDASRMWSTS